MARSDFWVFMAIYGGLFALYGAALLLQARCPGTWRAYIALGIATRLLLLGWGLPNLSDDAYRFLWAGRLTMANIFYGFYVKFLLSYCFFK